MKKIAFILIPLVMITFAFILQEMTLSSIEKRIAKEHPVQAISHERLGAILASDSSSSYMVFDVRKADEFTKSHLRGAMHIDPDTPAEQFIDKYGDSLAQKNLIFYCSVGYRSSIFLERVDSLAQKNGAASLANLTGGIFRWYNEKLPIYNEDGETDEVHPFNAFWGKLLVKER